MRSLSVIVPTYNEAETIGRLIARITGALAALDYELVVVDDSVDGTDRILAELAAAVPVLRVLHRDRRGGLASAVIDGINTARGDVVCVLDADLQHPPEVLPRLYRALQETDADLAIGSRYIPGGRYDFSLPRRVISRVAIALAQALLPRARAVSDPVSGFFAFRRRAVEDVRLRPLGFKILLEILIRGHISRIVEVPYHFVNRGAGESKLTMAQNWEYLRHLARLHRELPSSGAVECIVFHQDPEPKPPPDEELARRGAAKRREFVRYLEEGPLPAVRIAQGIGRAVSPQLSVIIPMANASRAATLERLLQQLTAQRFQEFEVIIVQGDRRQGRAINTGAAIARGSILVTMDDDTQLGDNVVLEALVRALEQDRTIGIAGVPNQIPSDAPPLAQRALRELPRRSSPMVETITDSDLAEHPCLAIRKELFYRLGGEHEQIPRGLDPYLRREVRRLAYRVVVIPGTSIHHLLPATFWGILCQYFRNGMGAAYVAKFYPRFVIEQTVAHGEAVRPKTSLARRAGRYLAHLASALASRRWIYLGTLAAYAAGYGWGLLSLRRDSL
ncbi:MAG TPA: glycosyltransferase [bacterium]|nr:glycosyltransferase [bacterium]